MRYKRREIRQRPSTYPAIVRAMPVRGYYTSGREAAGSEWEPPLFATYWRALARHKIAFALLCLGGIAAGLLVSALQPRTYRARAAVEIQGSNEDILNLRNFSPNSSGAPGPEYDINTQTTLMRSRGVLDRAISNVGAQKIVAAERPSRIFSARLGSDKRSLKDSDKRSLKDVALGIATAGLNIQTLPSTRLIEIRFDSPDPKLSAVFANAVAAAFIELTQEKRWQHIQATSEWLNGQMRDVKAKLEKSEDELRDLSRGSDLMFTPESGNDVAAERLRRLQEELSRAEAERAARQSGYELVATAAPETLPQVLDDPTLREYQLELTRLNRELADLSQTFTPSHPKVAKVQAQIALVGEAFRGTFGRNGFEGGRAGSTI